MNFKSLIRKIALIVIFFTVETLTQIVGIVLFLFYADTKSRTSFADAIWDGIRYMGTLKLVFFLPVYLLYYLINKYAARNFVRNHFLLHFGCLGILSLLFTPFFFSANGLFMALFAITISILISYVFYAINRKLINKRRNETEL